ncbi:unnamed protein product [Musa banksii]
MGPWQRRRRHHHQSYLSPLQALFGHRKWHLPPPSMKKKRKKPQLYWRALTMCNSYSFNGPSGKDDGFASSSDPELKRKRRVASYNSFAMERKLKSSVRNSFKWIKNKFTDAVYGV